VTARTVHIQQALAVIQPQAKNSLADRTLCCRYFPSLRTIGR